MYDLWAVAWNVYLDHVLPEIVVDLGVQKGAGRVSSREGCEKAAEEWQHVPPCSPIVGPFPVLGEPFHFSDLSALAPIIRSDVCLLFWVPSKVELLLGELEEGIIDVERVWPRVVQFVLEIPC